MRTGEVWRPGTSYKTAFLEAYKKVGRNIQTFSREEGAGKYAAIPLYTLYVLLYSSLLIYPVFETIEEAKKLKEPITETVIMDLD